MVRVLKLGKNSQKEEASLTYKTYEITCPKCKAKWTGTWPKGIPSQVCIKCGYEWRANGTRKKLKR